jgi:hypothetical protein
MKRYLSTTILASGLCVRIMAMQLHANLNDLVSNAHVVVAATCLDIRSRLDPEHPGHIVSTASFGSVETLRLVKMGTAPLNGQLDLYYLGGTTDELSMYTCLMPRFRVGERYVLFLVNDGIRYMSPVVGGEQGLMRMLRDPESGEEYILDADGYGIAGLDSLEWVKTPKVLRMVNDEPQFDERSIRSAEEMDIPTRLEAEEGPVSLARFTELVNSIGSAEPSMDRFKLDAQAMPRLRQEAEPGNGNAHQTGQRGPLGACLHQDVYIGFEENGNLSGYGAEWAAIEDYAKAIWDVHMNIFSDDAQPSDGYYGADNGENEICGWLSSSETLSEYGFAWPPLAGAMIRYWATNLNSGGEITECDIMMNGDLAWTTEWSTASTSNAINYRNVIVHEMGHAWGYQAGNCYDETYDYAYPSVMHEYYFGQIWEDGLEIHARDASVIRDLYDDQTTVKTVRDVGVESYRGLDGTGLLNSYAVPWSVPAGEPMTVHRFTVENNSNSTQNYIHLRYYLSTNRSLTSSDHLVKDVALGSMVAVSRKIEANGHALNTAGVPPGTYYIGAKVTRDGYDDDDRPANDITWSTYTVQITPGTTGGISELSETPALGVHPNPTTGLVTVVLPEAADAGEVTVFDLTGRRLLTVPRIASAERLVQIDLSFLPTGSYMVQYHDDEGMRSTGWVVMQ